MRSANDKLVLLDPILLADLHRSGWRGGMAGSASYRLAVADPLYPSHCPSALREDLNAVLRYETVRRIPLEDALALGELHGVQRFFSYSELVMLAIARTEGYSVASEGSVFLREAPKLIPAGKLLSRAQLISLTGLILEQAYERLLPQSALAGGTEIARLWHVWGDAGDAATKEAHTRLKAQGIGVVAKREGVVIEERPGGDVRPLNVKKRN